MIQPALARLRAAGSAVLQVAAPQRCIHCLAAGSWLCRPCLVHLSALPRPDLVCVVCGQPAARGMTCRQCRHDTSLTGAVSGVVFAHTAARRAVHWLKFRGVADMAPLLAGMTAPVLPVIAPLRVLQREAVLVPLPLHRHRLRQRGYNQSALLAAALSELTRIPVAAALRRDRATAAQAQLPPDLRGSNVLGAFARQQGARLAPRVLLVDDVLTTGSTLLAAAAALSAPPGVREVWGVTAARG